MSIRVAVIGVGLIGGSIGLALKGSAMIKEITGIDADPAALDQAVQIGAIDRAAGLEDGIREADVVFICTPLGAIPGLVRAIRPHLKPGCIVTDAGSVKGTVMDTFRRELPEWAYGIGGHPMAGSEITGLAGADRYLFENAVWVMVAPEDIPSGPVDTLRQLVEQMGARVIALDADRHDSLVAAVSHLPHLAAAALVNQVAGEDEALMLSAGGFRDTTRIASSNPSMWEEILFSNRQAVIDRLEGFLAELTAVRDLLRDGARSEVVGRLEKARAARDAIPKGRKGLLPDFCEVIAIVPDKPGVIGYIGTILGETGINIADIEILRVREGDGGTLRLGVSSVSKGETAVGILRERGIKAWLR